MTREELEKQGLLLPKSEIEKFSKGYASIQPFPKFADRRK